MTFADRLRWLEEAAHAAAALAIPTADAEEIAEAVGEAPPGGPTIT